MFSNKNFIMVLVVGILFLIGAGCQRNVSEPSANSLPVNADVADVAPSLARPVAATPPADQRPSCLLTETLIRRHCSVSGIFRESYNCTFLAKPTENSVSDMAIARLRVRSWSQRKWDDIVSGDTVEALGVSPWEESGVGESALLFPLSADPKSPPARATVDKKGFILYIKNGEKIYDFTGFGSEYNGWNSNRAVGSCSVEQMKKIANEIIR